MNLIKNVDGTWDYSKKRVRQDLDTIQRTLNALQAQVDAIVIPTPVPPAVISAANTVTTYDTDFLRSVATKPRGGLTGNGKTTNPLSVSVDGTTITINALGQLVSGGGGGGGTTLSEARILITHAQILTLGSVPLPVVPAAAVGFMRQVLWCNIQLHLDPATFYSVGQNASLYFNNGTMGTVPIFFIQTLVPGGSIQADFTQGQMNNAVINTTTGVIPSGAAVYIQASGNNTLGSGTTGSFINVSTGYVTIAQL